MGYLGNTPDSQIVLRLQARKSFALGLWIQDQNGNPLDISGSSIRVVIRKRVPVDAVDDSGNLISSSEAVIMAPTLGFARVAIQAAELNHPPGEYLINIVLSNAGYSSTIINGVVELEQNTEFTSMDETFIPSAAFSSSLEIALNGGNTVNVRTGPTLAPGAVTFTAEMEEKLLSMYAGAIANGTTLTADDIADGTTKVMMTAAERLQLSNLSLAWDDIAGKPDFGDIITYDAADFLPASGIDASKVTGGVLNNNRVPTMHGLRGNSDGTAAPSGGADNDFYFQYTP